jgi:hypothetical protein
MQNGTTTCAKLAKFALVKFKAIKNPARLGERGKIARLKIMKLQSDRLDVQKARYISARPDQPTIS